MVKVENKSILKDMTKLNNIVLGENEGERLINISVKSNNVLGRLLSPLHTSNTLLFCGRVAKIKAFMEAIKTPGYPLELLGKDFLSKKDLDSIPRQKVELPNFWALVAYAVCERVKQDTKLMDMLKVNNLEFTILEKPKIVSCGGKQMKIEVLDLRMSNYVSIVRHIELMIKEETFLKQDENGNYVTIDEFVNKCKAYPEKDLFENIQLPFNEVKQES